MNGSYKDSMFLRSPHRHRPLFRLLELFRAFGDGLCFARGINIAQPNGLGAEDQDGPAEQGLVGALVVDAMRGNVLRRRGSLKAARQKRAKCPFNRSVETGAK